MSMPRAKPAPLAQAVENVTDLLTCPICLEPYDSLGCQPKMLLCHHSFCQECLVSLVQPDLAIECPTCRQPTMLAAAPPQGIHQLQTNFYVSHMKELVHVSGSRGPKSRSRDCRKHQKVMDMFCVTCEMPLCVECCDSDHRNHRVKDMIQATDEQSRALQMEIATSQEFTLKSTQKIRDLETQMSCLHATKDKGMEDINTMFDKYIDALNQRREELKTFLFEAYTENRDSLCQEIEACKGQNSSLTGLVDQCHDAIEEGNILDIMAYRAKLRSKNTAMVKKSTPSFWGIYWHFQATEQDDAITSIIPELGYVAGKDPLPCTFHLQDKAPVSGLFTTLSLEVLDCHGGTVDSCPITVDICDPADNQLPAALQCQNSGLYEVTFRPEISGLHRVKVRFLDSPIKHGTFGVDVKSNDPVQRIGYKGGQKAAMEYPRAVCTDSQNNLFVMDTGNKRIQKFDASGQFVHQFPVAGEHEPYSSCGLAVCDAQGTILCPQVCLQEADLTHANAVLMFSLDGQLQQRFSYKDILAKALSIAVNSHGQMIVADSEENAVFILDRHGRVLRKFGETGNGLGQFNRPGFVCVGGNDSIIVADGENHRIQVFDKVGKFLYQFGQKGSGKGQFLLPFGVAADFHDNILVVDSGNKRLQIFKTGGKFLASIESISDPLNAPRGIAVSSDGYAFIADRDNHCVKKYKYLHCTSV